MLVVPTLLQADAVTNLYILYLSMAATSIAAYAVNTRLPQLPRLLEPEP
jgi:hypothetical protein